jgi:hypothetical protein
MVTETEHAHNEVVLSHEGTNPYNGEPGTLTAIATNSIFHVTFFENGNEFWVTGTHEGTATFTPKDPSGVSGSGHADRPTRAPKPQGLLSCGTFWKADEGIRTLDLRHGKATKGAQRLQTLAAWRSWSVLARLLQVRVLARALARTATWPKREVCTLWPDSR